MESYRVLIKPSAVKELEAAPIRDRRRLVARIQALASGPRPAGCEKLVGKDRYRVRRGNYRIVYSIEDAARIVRIVKIGHRSEVYR